jgi:Skp family chaperone for outer membrane proteins
MTMTMPEEKWTDERLDDSFARVGGDIRELRAEMNQRFDKVDARFEKVDAKFEKVDARFEKLDAKFDTKFDRLTWVLLAAAAGIIAALIGTNVL